MKLLWLVIVLSAVLLTGAEDAEVEDSTIQPVATKTVYGFLDFTTTVSDTVMIFKPSKTPGNKGRNAAAGRSAPGILTKPGKTRSKIDASQPSLEVSATVPLSREESRGRLKHFRPAAVHIESSMVDVDDEHDSSSSVKSSKRPELTGTGQVVSSFPVMKSHVVVSSRVDIRIGGANSKVNGPSKSQLPKQVAVRAEMNLSPAMAQLSASGEASKQRKTMPAGQSLVSKTVGTRIQNGVTTIHETSVIATTIDGERAHFVQSTSTVFKEPQSTAISSPGRLGSVEVVTEASSVKPVSADEDEAHLASLPSLESLFESVSPTAEPLKSAQPEEEDEEVAEAILRTVSQKAPVTTTSSSLGRRVGVASPPRLRTEEQRWRYNPNPKPKVTIQRHGGSRLRPTTPNPDSDDAPEPESDLPDPTEVITLRVQTVTPEGFSNLYYEVATIKSPYIMRLGAVRNTRYVTLTRSFTRLVTPTPPPSAIVTPTAEIYGSYDQDGEVSLDGSQSLPDPENILATTTPYENILKDSSDVATLPAIIVAATESEEGLSLRTVTETFSTTELTMKTSTSLMTLTQSYFITRVVVAVKTVPPSDLYQFIPSKTLTDISTNLQEAGSEHNERLLPGELEFSENDEYADDDDHRNEKRVPAPDIDLSSIGQDFDPSSMDRPQVDLEPSIVDTSSDKFRQGGTPPLPSFGQLEPSSNQQNLPGQYQETPSLSPEQLQQLALFRFMNPYAAAAAGLPFGYPGLPGFGGAPQVITTSRPVVKTIDVIKTETLPIWDGARTLYSTLTRIKGTTVVTETEYGTTTLAASPQNGLNPALFGNIQPQYTVVSSPVVTEITTTSTELRIYRIIFRAQTTYTTVTSTSVFPTIVTTFVSSTVPVQPTAFPQGLFPGSFGFPNFG